MAGMTGEMNIITGTHQNALLLPTRALLIDQALIVKRGIVQSRTVKIGYRTLDFSEVLEGLSEGDRVVLSDQDKLRPGRPVRQSRHEGHAARQRAVTPPLYIALRFLRHRKRSFILSLLGVVFGVAIFICTQAQTQGFAKNFIDSTLGSNGALLLRSRFQTRHGGSCLFRRRTFGIRISHAAIRSMESRTRPRSCGSAASSPMSPPAPPFCAGPSARGPDSITRRSISSASMPSHISRRPISRSNLLPAISTIFATTRTPSSSVPAWPTHSRWRRATRCNSFPPAGNIAVSSSPRRRAAE